MGMSQIVRNAIILIQKDGYDFIEKAFILSDLPELRQIFRLKEPLNSIGKAIFEWAKEKTNKEAITCIHNR